MIISYFNNFFLLQDYFNLISLKDICLSQSKKSIKFLNILIDWFMQISSCNSLTITQYRTGSFSIAKIIPISSVASVWNNGPRLVVSIILAFCRSCYSCALVSLKAHPLTITLIVALTFGISSGFIKCIPSKLIFLRIFMSKMYSVDTAKS